VTIGYHIYNLYNETDSLADGEITLMIGYDEKSTKRRDQFLTKAG
jgi:hypothetical protein